MVKKYPTDNKGPAHQFVKKCMSRTRTLCLINCTDPIELVSISILNSELEYAKHN